MTFNHKPILDKENYGCERVNNSIRLTFGHPYSQDIIEQLDFLSKRIMIPFTQKYNIPNAEKVLLSEGIKRDLGATILSIVSESIDTPYWTLSYEEINPSFLFDTSKEFERGIQKMIQKVMAGLPSEIVNNKDKNNLLMIRLSLALNNEMCRKKKALEAEMLPELKTPERILSYIILGENEEEKQEKVNEVKKISENIINKVKAYYPQLNNCDSFFSNFSYEQMCENVIYTTADIFKATMEDIKNAENPKMIIPIKKECPALQTTTENLHREIDKDINKIHDICIKPHIVHIAANASATLLDEGIIEDESEIVNRPEIMKLYGMFKISSTNLRTAIIDTILQDINISEKIRNHQIEITNPILNDILSNPQAKIDDYSL